MKYYPKDFRNSTPSWKRKKETFIGKILYRPLSYAISSILGNLGIRANSVSYFSMFVAAFGCCLFLFNNHTLHIIGGVVFVIWAVLDCVDGDMARTIGKQPFGEFADAISCYILQGMMCLTMAVAVFHEGGFLIEAENVLIVVVGGMASIANCLMRLIYQKYVNGENDLVEKGIVEKQTDIWKDKSQAGDFRVKFKETMGVGGILPFLILGAEMFKALDLIIIYCFIIYGGAFLVSSINYVRKAIRITKKYEAKGLHKLDNLN